MTGSSTYPFVWPFFWPHGLLCHRLPLTLCNVGSPLTFLVVPVQQCPMYCERQRTSHLGKSKVMTDSPLYLSVWVFFDSMISFVAIFPHFFVVLVLSC